MNSLKPFSMHTLIKKASRLAWANSIVNLTTRGAPHAHTGSRCPPQNPTGLKQVAGLVFPLVEFGRDDNVQYNMEIYLGAETLMCLNSIAAEQGMEIYADNAAALAEAQTETDSEVGKTGNMSEKASPSPAAEIDGMDVDLDIELDERGEDPDVPKTPTGDAHLRTIQLLDRDDILQLVQNGIGMIVNAASRHADLFERQVIAAIDTKTVGYWADGDELEMAMGAPPDKEYDR